MRDNFCSRWKPALILALLAATGAAGEDAATEKPAGKHYALLVGCTKYNDKLAKSLEGPANDVKLVRDTLTQYFGFKPEDCLTLSEEAAASQPDRGEKLRPTRANIQREFETLINHSKSGDQVFILLGGHGSRQPDHEPFDEPDGFDEVFLPADAEPYDPQTETFPNCIVDDEFHDWVTKLADTGAAICVVVDACHSGTMLRSLVEDVVRDVKLEDFTSQDARDAAVKRARERKLTAQEERSPLALQTLKGRVVGIYAARNDECEIETPLPTLADGKKKEMYGLLSYTLCQILTPKQAGAGRPLTYREAVQRVRERYLAMGRSSAPTPLVEGPDADREVFGVKQWPARSRLAVRKTNDGWKLSGGRLHGLSPGSILRVFPPVGESDDDKSVGFISVTSAGLMESSVEPCEFDKQLPLKMLPLNGRCEPASIDLGDLRLKVAVRVTDKPDSSGAAPDAAKLTAALKKLAAGKPPLPIALVAADEPADWRLYRDGADVFLEPACGVQLGQGQTKDNPFRLELSRWEESLEDRLGTISRAEMLKRVAAGSANAEESLGTAVVDVGVEIFKYTSLTDKNPRRVAYGPGIQLQAGDIVAFKVTNRSRVAKIYFTLLFIDAQYGIDALYPGDAEIAKPINPGEEFVTKRLRVNARTVGTENLVAIAVKAKGDPTDFTWLAQRSLASGRASPTISRGFRPPNGWTFWPI